MERPRPRRSLSAYLQTGPICVPRGKLRPPPYPKSNVAADIQISTPQNSQFTIYTSLVRQYVTIYHVYSVSELEPENEADRKSRKLYRAERNTGLRQSQGFTLSFDCSMYWNL